MNSPMRMSEDRISLALRCVDVSRRSRFRPLMTSHPTTPMYIGRDVVGSRCLSPSASRQKIFHQLATMAMSRAIARHGFRSFVTNPPKSEQRRKRRVVSHPVDVDVPRKSADDREHGRADDVADIGGVSFCGWLFCFATQSIPCFEGRYFRSPIG